VYINAYNSCIFAGKTEEFIRNSQHLDAHLSCKLMSCDHAPLDGRKPENTLMLKLH